MVNTTEGLNQVLLWKAGGFNCTIFQTLFFKTIFLSKPLLFWLKTLVFEI